ncbi:MAG: hypothetical protein EAZ92_11810 [Candidatus Kapaibacterium sp.]|nr:MAG: hypothetical protein EAZ92_11810 [Candidatus Kapabacteria bacterium]
MFIVPRLLLLPMQPWLSDDAPRYLWDAHVLLQGMNPYLLAPNAPELLPLRGMESALYAVLDYRDISSIYPPLAEMSFVCAVWCGKLVNPAWWAGFVVWKMLLVISEGIGIACVYAVCRRLGFSPSGIVLYCCLPLPALELAGQGHLDGLLAAPLGIVLYLFALFQKQEKPVFMLSCGIGLGVAMCGAIKILPLVMVLPIMRYLAQKRDVVAFAGFLTACCFGLIVLCFPLLHDAAILQQFLLRARNNALSWQFNGGAYYALCYVAAALHLREYWLWMPSAFAALRLGVIGVVSIFQKTSNEAVFTAILTSLSLVLLFAAKVHTWYFVPLLLVNTLVGWVWLPVLASGSLLSYAYYSVQPPREQYGVEMLVWGASVLVMVWELWKRMKNVPKTAG